MTTDHVGAAPAAPSSETGRAGSLRWVAIAILIGVALGVVFPDGGTAGFHASDLQVLSNLFLRLIKSLVAPLLFATLVVGIAGHGEEMAQVGRLAIRSLCYFEVVTTLAMLVGLLAVNLVKPGVGVDLCTATMEAGSNLAQARPTLASTLEHAVPQSIVDAAARNDVLQIVCFAVIFGIALSQVRGPAQEFMLSLCSSLSAVMFRFVGIVMRFAPVGIGAAMAVTVGHSGIGVLRNLGSLVLTLYASLIAFALLVLLPVALAFRVPLRAFWRATQAPWLVAFSTSSSEAALPLAFRNMEALGVPRRIVAFVLPTGYSFNMDGTALYLSLASVFVAQAAGINMPLSRQLLMVGTLMLTSKGVAAVPRTSLVVLAGTLAQFDLPLQGIAVILGVDALMDMARTSLNLLGNCLATVVMARWEGTFAPQTTPAPAVP
ncbi:MAG: dicarboxylate/amino acid:cation symporter [Gemmatimonadota bacterium]